MKTSTTTWTQASSASDEWRNHWSLVLASTLGIGLGVMHLYSMGAFIEPLEHAFGWQRLQVSSALSIVTALSVVSAYVVGLLVDRFGPRRIALPGIVLYCSAFASLASLHGSLAQWWACWGLIAISVQLVKPTVWVAAVASRFVSSRGLAISVVMTGTGAASIINPVLATFLLERFGWRVAYLGLAAAWALIALPVCWFCFYGFSDQMRRRNTAVDRETMPGLDLRQALTGRRFWTLAASVVMATLIVMGLMVHFIPLAIAGGISPASAAFIASIMGFSSVGGRLLTGLWIDRMNGRLVAAAAFMLPCVACLLLMSSAVFADRYIIYVIAACLTGFALGADGDLGAYLVSRYFGIRRFGALYGALIGLLGLATGGGPLLAGYIYDMTQSYVAYLQVGVAGSIASSLLILTLGPYPEDFRVEPAKAPPATGNEASSELG